MATQTGTDGPDVLTGGPDGDILLGNGGADTLYGSTTGFTFAAYWSSPGPVRIELFRDAAFDGFGSPGSRDELHNIHGVFGSAFGDGMLGSDLPDVLVGLDGGDTIFGAGGDDVLNGGGGDDVFDGGEGNDTAVYSGTRADYAISATDTGFVIVDNRGSGDGADTVAAVETFQFEDGNLTAANLLTGTPTPPTEPTEPTPPTPPVNTVDGTEGDDRLVPASGDNIINGRGGHDWVDLAAQGHRGDTVQAQSDGSVQLAHGGHTYTLVNVEEVRFLDGRLVFDAADPAAQVARLYEAALNRLPEQGGLNFWIDAVQHGQPLNALASGFLTSSEFAARFGDTAANSAFVDRLYLNVLDRPGEADGRAFWINSLDHGTARADVLVAFSESAENKAGTAALVQGGIWDRSEAAAEVARLYDTVLGRTPDTAGLGFWKTGLETGTASLEQMADSFTSSAEFQAKYGSLGNRDFADALYVNTLDRHGDQQGLDYWTGVLDAGIARSAVVLGFSESAEHVDLTAHAIQSENPAEFGIVFA